MARWVVEPFRPDHNRAGFESGVTSLDTFILDHVTQYDRRRVGKTYVAVEPGGVRVLGYYTLVAGALPFESLPPALNKKLPRHPVPVALVARLAVTKEAQGRKLGELLLVDALVKRFRCPRRSASTRLR